MRPLFNIKTPSLLTTIPGYDFHGVSPLDFKLIVGGVIVGFLLASLVVRSRRPKTPVWSIMNFTAFITVVSGLVGLEELSSVINLDVILFLIGMFSISSLAERSGLLAYIAGKFISLFKTRRSLILASSLLFGLLAAISMNDTVALMGPPIAYIVSKALGVDPRMMFLLLAFSITIGSVMTPIGNPQNMLITDNSGLQAPFVRFALTLSLPTLLNLIVTPLVLMRVYGVVDGRRSKIVIVSEEKIRSRRDAALAMIGLVSSVTALVLNDILQLLGLPHIEERGFIPFIIASAIYMFSEEPRRILAGVDWGTIVFFISMFITMEGVWKSGVLNPLLNMFPLNSSSRILNIVSLSLLSIIGSQIVSNVPFTKLMLNKLHELGYTGSQETAWLTLAMATTIAGNLTLLGAASNIIIIEYLESRMGYTISFIDFAKIGVLITLINLAIYLVFLIVI